METNAAPACRQDSDQDLVAAVRSADRQAFEEFVRRNQRWVRGVIYAVISRMDGLEDVCQQVWLAVWRKAGELQELGNWRGWLYRLAKNAALDSLRRAGHRRRIGQVLRDWLASRPPKQHSELDRIADDEQHSRVLQAIREMPDIYREPFILRHLEDWDCSRIGQALDMPVDTVETRLVRARRMLRERLSGQI